MLPHYRMAVDAPAGRGGVSPTAIVRGGAEHGRSYFLARQATIDASAGTCTLPQARRTYLPRRRGPASKRRLPTPLRAAARRWLAGHCAHDCELGQAQPGASSGCRHRKLPKHLGLVAERMERAMGFEPTTSTLARLRSTPELRPHPPGKGRLRGAARLSRKARTIAIAPDGPVRSQRAETGTRIATIKPEPRGLRHELPATSTHRRARRWPRKAGSRARRVRARP